MKPNNSKQCKKSKINIENFEKITCWYYAHGSGIILKYIKKKNIITRKIKL